MFWKSYSKNSFENRYQKYYSYVSFRYAWLTVILHSRWKSNMIFSNAKSIVLCTSDIIIFCALNIKILIVNKSLKVHWISKKQTSCGYSIDCDGLWRVTVTSCIWLKIQYKINQYTAICAFSGRHTAPEILLRPQILGFCSVFGYNRLIPGLVYLS